MLTAREKEVMELMAEGLTNKQIAKKLSTSELTIRTHAQNIYEKFGVSVEGREEKGVVRVRAVIHWLKNKVDILKN